MSEPEYITMTSTLGVVITAARERSGLTLRDAAGQLGIDYTYLSKLEHDASKPPSDRVLAALAALYGLDDDLLFTLSGKVPPDLRQAVTNPSTIKRLRAMLVDPDPSYRELLATRR